MKPTSSASSIVPDALAGSTPQSITDRELAEKIARGAADANAAYNLLYSRYAADILAFLESRLPYRTPAEDVAQEVWIIVYQKLNSFDGKNFRAWLFEIARNRATDDLRKVIRRKEVHTQLIDEFNDMFSASIEEDEQLLALKDCLRLLDGPFIRTLISFKLEGQTVEDLARQEQVQVGTVYTRIDRAKRQLTDCVQRKLS